MIKSLINKHLGMYIQNSYMQFIFAILFCIVSDNLSCFSLLLVDSTLYGKRQIITPCKCIKLR